MKKITFFLLRLSLGGIFIYFGYLAVTNPEIQAAIWLPGWVESLVASVIPVKWFMTLFGVLEILVGLGIILKKIYKVALGLAAAMLLGIIIVIGVVVKKSGGGFTLNEVALRDIVLLMTTLYLLAEETDR